MKELVGEQLTLFQVGSRASRSVLPGSEEARKMTVTSGLKCLELSKKSGPLGLLEKMFLVSSIWASTLRYLTWKPKVTKQGRLYYQLAVSVPRTKETESQFWHTMTANDAKNSSLPQSQIKRNQLVGQVMREMFPTPTARDYRSADLNPNSRRFQRLTELNTVIAMLPTPTTFDATCGDLEGKEYSGKTAHAMKLIQAAKMYPTMTAGKLSGGTGSQSMLKDLQKQGKITEEERRSMSQGNGGQLNPEWVEWLMGFPLGWTEL